MINYANVYVVPSANVSIVSTMACSTNFGPASFRLPEFSTTTVRHPKSTIFPPRKLSLSIAAPYASPEESTATPDKPLIELEFIGPKAEADGKYPVERANAVSGEKLLRNIMLDNKIELYATYGKVMNCGGGGSCGTCIVEIIDGKDLLNDRTATELKYLKNKPETWRLACQTIVGNKENSGQLVVQRLPQWKK